MPRDKVKMMLRLTVKLIVILLATAKLMTNLMVKLIARRMMAH
jgi:hypothetical protein